MLAQTRPRPARQGAGGLLGASRTGVRAPSDTTSPAASSTLRLSAQHGGAPMLCVKRRRVAGLLVGVVEGTSH